METNTVKTTSRFFGLRGWVMTHTPEKNGENTFCDVDGSMNGIVGFLYNW